jgi:ATP-dependent protease ClpP protease subunit
MENVILLYTGIYSWVAETFVKEVMAADQDKDLVVRLNTGGGGVYSGNAMIKVITEHKGKKIARPDGIVASMGVIMLPYFDEVISSPLAQFMIHRADGWVSTDEEQVSLDNLNKDFRKKLESKIDVKAFEEMKGVKFSKIFEAKERLDFYFTAKEALKIKLIDKIEPLDSKTKKALRTASLKSKIYSEMELKFAASLDIEDIEVIETKIESKKEITNNNNTTQETMNKKEFKSQYPQVFAEVLAEGEAIGVEGENIRVQAWNAWQEVDSVAVKAGIESGKSMNQLDVSKMQVSALKKGHLTASTENQIEDVQTSSDAVDKTEAQIKADSFDKEVKAGLNLKEEVKNV